MKTLSERLEDLAAREYVVEVGPHGTVVDDAFDADTQELIREAVALAKRYEDAATGECMEVGDLVDCDGQPFIGAIIESTREELKRGPGIVYKRVRIVLDKEG